MLHVFLRSRQREPVVTLADLRDGPQVLQDADTLGQQYRLQENSKKPRNRWLNSDFESSYRVYTAELIKNASAGTPYVCTCVFIRKLFGVSTNEECCFAATHAYIHF